MLNFRSFLVFSLVSMLVGASTRASADDITSRLIDESLAGAQRSAEHRARDVYRHPKQTLQFFGLEASQTVIEVMPEAGWYTEVLAPVLRSHGQLFEAVDPVDGDAEERRARQAFEAKLKSMPSVYDHVKLVTLPTTSKIEDFPRPGQADLVLTFRNIHNWIKPGYLDNALRAFNAALKPGGVLGVVEHRAADDASLDDSIANGYVPEDFVIKHAKAAGFDLVARSQVNANPKDTKDYAKGVWALPPTLAGGDVDRDRLLAIGESDRMTLKFVKRH